jgi:hypothetical protein
MANTLSLSARDLSILRLLGWTPATTASLFRASIAFEGGPFVDERRLRERMQSLGAAGFVRSWGAAHSGGGLQNYYKLTPTGFQRLYGPDAAEPSRAFFSEISPSLFEHTMRLSEIVVEIVRACSVTHVTIERFFRENELTFTAGTDEVHPDCFVRLKQSGRFFNVAFEIDMSQESLDSHATNSIRQKLQTYDAYQDVLLAEWRAHGKTWECPRFRVVFLTRSVERAYHILTLAGHIAKNRNRRLVYAATQETFLSDQNPILSPIFLDHFGNWQALVDLHSTSKQLRDPVRLPSAIERGTPF